jgi:Protein of unknown function (DUF3540)
MMRNNIYKIRADHGSAEFQLVVAEVVSVGAERIELRSEVNKALSARVSASCLLVPEPGDSVLVYDSGYDATSFVLSILTKKNLASGQLAMPAGGSIHSNQEGLTVRAKNIGLLPTESLTIGTKSIFMVAKKLTTYVDLLLQKVKDSYRSVEGVDQTDSGRYRLNVKGRYLVRTRHISMRSTESVDIDGKKINLG